MKRDAQKDRVLNHLMSGKSLNRISAWEKLGILEAPARICELRKSGYDIETTPIELTNCYGDLVVVASWHLNIEAGEPVAAP